MIGKIKILTNIFDIRKKGVLLFIEYSHYNTTIFNANKHEFVLYSYNAGNVKDMQLPDVYALDIFRYNAIYNIQKFWV